MRKTIIFDLDDTLIRHDRSDETKFLAEYLNICYSEDFSIAFLYTSIAGSKSSSFSSILPSLKYAL